LFKIWREERLSFGPMLDWGRLRVPCDYASVQLVVQLKQVFVIEYRVSAVT
jgi:hypothetical protein